MGPIFLSALRLPEIVRSTERRSPGAANSIEMSPVVSGNGSNKSFAGDQPHSWFEPRASVLVAAPHTNFSVLLCMCWLLEPKVAMVAGCLVGALATACTDASAGVRRIPVRCAPMSFEGCPGCCAFDADPSRTGATGREGSRRTSVEACSKASMSDTLDSLCGSLLTGATGGKTQPTR